MPLSSAFSPDKTPNIKDVNYTPEKKTAEKPFDPERDITPEDWQGMLENLNEYRQSGNWSDFSSQASELLQLFPERRAELKLGETEFQGMLEDLNEYRQSGNWDSFSYRALSLKLLLADEIKQKADGTLEITFNKPKPTQLREETPPPPIMRRY